MLVCSILFFTKKEEHSITIKQPIEIKHLDSLLNKNKTIIIIQKDTLNRGNSKKKITHL